MPKIQLHPNLAKLKEVLETGHNLVDHFLVCGIPPSACLQEFLYQIKNQNFEEIFKENIKPSIISRFPEFDNSIDSVDDEIINYCFPEGFLPVFSENENLKPKFYTILLDNNLFSIEYPQKYLSCLLFYEKINNYRELRSKIEEEEKGFYDIEEVEEFEVGENKDNIGQENKIIDNNGINKDKINKKMISEQANPNSDLTSIFKQTSSEMDLNPGKNNNAIKNKTLRTLAKHHTSIQLSVNRLKRSTQIIDENLYLYIPKVICLVSIHPYVKTFEKILYSIYSYFTDLTKPKEIPLEKIITNLIIEVPIPPRGLYSIKYDKFILKGYENNKLLVTENNLMHFNSKISFKTKLEVFKHILFCSKVVFFSKNLNLLSETILSFLVLLYPFKYPFQVTSYVNKDSYNILGCLSPFMFGINEEYRESFMDDNDIITNDMNIFMVDLDNKDKYFLITNETFPNFPARLTSNLEKEIKNLENRFKKESSENSLEKFNEAYQNIFFEFFCEILKGYEDYLNMDYFKVSDADKVTSTQTLFQCEKFIKMHSSSEVPFYNKFLDVSQLFSDFIYKRMIPRNTQELIDILIVNETNIKIKNRNKYFGQKEPTEFLESKDYIPVNKYDVPFPNKLTNSEYDTIIENKDKLLSYGQLITFSDEKINRSTSNKDISNSKENIQYNKLLFNYILFPQLDFKTYCNPNNVNDYIPPQDYSEEIEAINLELLSKSSLGQNLNLSLEMKNNLYLTWLEMWSYTFWYFDKDEREYRFDQVLDILDKVIHHEMNIFNLMFNILNQQNEQEMIIKLYQKMLLLKINPNTNIYNIISNILDNEQIKQLFDKMKSGEVISLKFNKKYTTLFKKRTYLNLEDKPTLVNEKLKFETVFSCIDCMEEINLYMLCKDFEGIKNDVLWAPCKNGHYNLPKLKINFGTEFFPLNTIKKPYQSTSSINDIVLHSPYNLKINIKNAIKNQYGTKCDVDKFKSDFSALFWNFIWYCKVINLDSSIILPYADRIEKKRMNRMIYNKNNDNIKLIYNNEIFKQMKNVNNNSNNNNNKKEETKKDIFFDDKFKNLKMENTISIEIQRAFKFKHKIIFSTFIDHCLKQKGINLNLNSDNKKIINKEEGENTNSLLGVI